MDMSDDAGADQLCDLGMPRVGLAVTDSAFLTLAGGLEPSG